MLAPGFKRCKSNAGVYYYHDKKTKVLVIVLEEASNYGTGVCPYRLT